MNNLIQRYQAASTAAIESADNWRDWFDRSKPRTEPDHENTWELVRELLKTGQAAWEDPRWDEDLSWVISLWVRDGKLTMVKLIAQQLIYTAPTGIEPKLSNTLKLLAQGEFLLAYPGESCRWPRRAQSYARELNLKMAEFAVDTEATQWVDTRIRLLKHEGAA